jgi:hypothetical protein
VARWHEITPSAGAGGNILSPPATGIFFLMRLLLLILLTFAVTLAGSLWHVARLFLFDPSGARRWSEHFDLSQDRPAL